MSSAHLRFDIFTNTKIFPIKFLPFHSPIHHFFLQYIFREIKSNICAIYLLICLSNISLSIANANVENIWQTFKINRGNWTERLIDEDKYFDWTYLRLNECLFTITTLFNWIHFLSVTNIHFIVFSYSFIFSLLYWFEFTWSKHKCKYLFTKNNNLLFLLHHTASFSGFCLKSKTGPYYSVCLSVCHIIEARK